MTQIETRRSFMKAMYMLSKGDSLTGVAATELKREIQMEDDEFIRTFTYLQNDGLVRSLGIGLAYLNITHAGVKFVEQLDVPPAEKTPNTALNYIRIDTNYGAVQQGNTGSHQTTNSNQSIDLEVIRDFIHSLRQHLAQLDLDNETQEEILADSKVVEVQLQSERPRFDKLKARLTSIITNIGEKVAVTEIAGHMDKVLGFLHQL